LSAPFIQDESYWKEACLQRWNKNNIIKVEMHGMLWKNAYIERHLQEYLENIEVVLAFRDKKMKFDKFRIWRIQWLRKN